MSRKEAVNHPQHYGGDVPHETWKCLAAWGLHFNAYLWNCVKYISGAGKKTPDVIEDLKKARWYLDREIERLEGNSENRKTIRKDSGTGTIGGRTIKNRVCRKS